MPVTPDEQGATHKASKRNSRAKPKKKAKRPAPIAAATRTPAALDFERRDETDFGPDPQRNDFFVVRELNNVPTIIDRLTLEGVPLAAELAPEGAAIGWTKNGDGIFAAPQQEGEADGE